MVSQVIQASWRRALAAAVMALVAGCGGGGGDNGAVNPPPVAAATFAVGGAVSGLGQGAALTLTLGSDKLQVAANGSFVFPNKLESGTAYSVSATAPGGYSCKVGDGTGTITGADVNKIAVACAPLLLAGAPSLLQLPLSIAIDASGNQYVLDGGTQSLLKIAPSGTATVLAGRTGKPGYVDGAAASARLHVLGDAAVVADAQGNLFIADNCNNVIRKVAADGAMTTLAGREAPACGNIWPGALPQVDGSGKEAAFERIGPMAADGAGGVIVVEMNSSATVRRVSAAGVVTTQTWPGSAFNDGSLYATQIARAPDGTLYFSDGERIWKTADGELVPVAGSFGRGPIIDGSGEAARFRRISGMTFAADGNLYVTDSVTVRKVTPAGEVSTLAGNGDLPGSADGIGAGATFGDLVSIAFDGRDLVVLDREWKFLRRVTLAGAVSTSAVTPPTRGLLDGSAGAVRMSGSATLSADADGNLVFVDYFEHVLRKATPAGVVTTIAGKPGVAGLTDGAVGSALLKAPSFAAAGRDGAIWVAQYSGLRRIQGGNVSTVDAQIIANDVVVDGEGNAIVSTTFPAGAVYKITPAGVKTLLVDAENVASLIKNTDFTFMPQALAIDRNGHLLITDSGSAAIYKLGPQGALSVFAGTPMKEGSADGPAGTGTLAFYQAPDLAVDDKGNVYFSGQAGVRVVSPAGVLSSPDFGWGSVWIYSLEYANGRLYGSTNYALLQTYLP
ncbi:MAG: hypothetical protein AB1807_10320 [Pseudomonadota bacterium]